MLEIMSKRDWLSRRRFLGAGVAAAAGASVVFAQQKNAEDNQPPAIAALPVLGGQARPFANSEREGRIERAHALMLKRKLDAVVLTPGTSLFYFANMRTWSSERLWALVLPARATPFLVCPAFEEGRAREMLASSPLGKDAAVLAWQEDESPFALLGKGLGDRGIRTGSIGLDETMKFVFADSLRAANPHLEFVSATPVTAGCRMIKDAHEIDCMRLACRATLLVYKAVATSVHPGMSNTGVEHLVDLAYQRVGFRGDASLNIDEYTALPHGSREPQTLREGSILMLDDGCTVEGYTSDITRTFVLGRPTAKMIAVFDIVKRAQSAALHAARPGALCADVGAAARKVIADAG